MSQLRLATFRVDITPPVGHPLCAGWIKPAVGITDELYALGVVLVGEEAPVVLCALDWCELSNREHTLWRERLAGAAGTTQQRVAVQCGHQHDAVWPDIGAQELVAQTEDLPDLMDVEWCHGTIDRVADAVRDAADRTQPVTHALLGEAEVEKVASNRRIMGPDGKVKAVRYTRCEDPAIRDEPEGLIDPMLKTISFWNGSTKLAVLHYYAVHPCSYYADGWVNKEFIGHARERRIAEDSGAEHIYFTGCAGNIGPGKYNDGSPENRPIFEARVYRAMVQAEQETERVSVERLEWRTVPLSLPADTRYSEEELREVLNNTRQTNNRRYKMALRIEYMHYVESGATIPLTALFLGDRICIVNLPGEAFIEYQLLSQALQPDRFVAVASYGDCGTGYIPMEKSYEEGGYEPTDAFVSPRCEAILTQALRELLV